MGARADQLGAPLDKQVKELAKILQQNAATEILKPQLYRWKDRTARLLAENLGEQEADD